MKDPAVAEKLIPKNHGYGTRRVPLESGYYEVFNQPNVRLIDVRETPIERFTPAGIKTSDAAYEFDMIIYATGFDAITGAYTSSINSYLREELKYGGTERYQVGGGVQWNWHRGGRNGGWP